MKANNLLPAILATFICVITPHDDADAATAGGGAKGGTSASAGKSAGGTGAAGARGAGAAARPTVPAGRLSLSARMNSASTRSHASTHETAPHIHGGYGGGYHYQPNYYFHGGGTSHTAPSSGSSTETPSASVPSTSVETEPEDQKKFKVMEQKGQIKKSFFKCLPKDGETWASFKERCQASEQSDGTISTYINTGCETTSQESARMFLHRCTSIPR